MYTSTNSDSKYKNYNTLSGGTISASSYNTTILLNTGVAVGVQGNTIAIDLNGLSDPNTVGIDRWTFDIQKKTDLNANPPTHAGEMGGRESYKNASKATLKSNCRGGIAPACYTLLERSGFDPDYINK